MEESSSSKYNIRKTCVETVIHFSFHTGKPFCIVLSMHSFYGYRNSRGNILVLKKGQIFVYANKM